MSDTVSPEMCPPNGIVLTLLQLSAVMNGHFAPHMPLGLQFACMAPLK